MNEWKIREAMGDDLSFIYSTWSKSYRYDSPLGKSCRNHVFFPEYNRVMDWILKQDDTKVLVACSPEDDVVMFGYLVYQPGILHYAFTKEAFWNFGIAKSLYQQSGGARYYTHKTMTSKPILMKHPEMVFNPFLLFKQEKSYGEK